MEAGRRGESRRWRRHHAGGWHCAGRLGWTTSPVAERRPRSLQHRQSNVHRWRVL